MSESKATVSWTLSRIGDVFWTLMGVEKNRIAAFQGHNMVASACSVRNGANGTNEPSSKNECWQ